MEHLLSFSFQEPVSTMEDLDASQIYAEPGMAAEGPENSELRPILHQNAHAFFFPATAILLQSIISLLFHQHIIFQFRKRKRQQKKVKRTIEVERKEIISFIPLKIC